MSRQREEPEGIRLDPRLYARLEKKKSQLDLQPVTPEMPNQAILLSR